MVAVNGGIEWWHSPALPVPAHSEKYLNTQIVRHLEYLVPFLSFPLQKPQQQLIHLPQHTSTTRLPQHTTDLSPPSTCFPCRTTRILPATRRAKLLLTTQATVPVTMCLLW